MLDTLILADDLSGAADCASSSHRPGASSIVLIDPWADPGDATVVAVDVNSRAKIPQEAGAVMTAQVQRLLTSRTRITYQKMDSTLRGNWARETACVLKAMTTIRGHRLLAVAAPAFPAAGRTLSGGRSFLNGRPLEATEIWAREGFTRPAAPAEWLAAEGLRVAQASLHGVRSGPGALSVVFAHMSAADADVIVCDAQTEDDLDTIARTALALVPSPLCVGSAGLMRALASREGRTAPRQAPIIPVAGPVLTVVGSASQVSLGQVQVLVERRAVTPIAIAPAVLRGGAWGPLRSVADRIDAALAAGKDIVVTIEGSDGVDLQRGKELSSALADLIAARLSRLGGLIATGGETARAILTRAGVPGLRIHDEVELGVPLSFALGRSGLSVITKAGAFGSAETLVRCIDAIRGRSIGA